MNTIRGNYKVHHQRFKSVPIVQVKIPYFHRGHLSTNTRQILFKPRVLNQDSNTICNIAFSCGLRALGSTSTAISISYYWQQFGGEGEKVSSQTLLGPI